MVQNAVRVANSFTAHPLMSRGKESKVFGQDFIRGKDENTLKP
jgi:hypothetical protein